MAKQTAACRRVRKKRRKKRKNLPVCRKDWDEHVAELRKGEFARRYRMSQENLIFY